MVQKKTVPESDRSALGPNPGTLGSGAQAALASAEEATLRRRVADMERELQDLRQRIVKGADSGKPAREGGEEAAGKPARMGSWYLNPDTEELAWSEELFRILGYDPAEDIPTTEKFLQALHPDDVPRAIKSLELFWKTGTMEPLELSVVRKDGSVRVVRNDGTMIRDEHGNRFHLMGCLIDVTDFRKAERDANRIARILREAQSMANVGSWVWDPATGAFDVSDEFKRIMGVSVETEFHFGMIEAMMHPEDRLKAPKYRMELAEKGFAGPVEMRLIQPDGNLRHTLMQAKRLEDETGLSNRFLGTVWDITDRKHLEEQLRQSQKMEVVGRVAGGVAHDFNNLLTVITGNVDLMLEVYDEDRLRRIRDAADVGAALTKQLLAFSRQAMVKAEALDLNKAIRDIVRIVDRLIGEDITIRLELAEEPAVIVADSAQVQQILLNLAVNARDAMGHGGELVFSTREAPGNPFKADTEPPRWVELKVRDTGKGMDPATRQRALEPFFTTKEAGKGTGLGLSTIADIVAHMKGTIAIDSEPNQGTLVTIRFPHSRAKVAPPPPVELKSRKGAESILLVEDNAELRELVRVFLTSAGYRVKAVGRPGEAEAIWKSEKDAFDLLVTDMVMPEKSGKDLAKALSAMKPGLKTLFISGYSPSRNGFGEWSFLQKPFTRHELLDAVRALCDKPVPGPSKP